MCLVTLYDSGVITSPIHLGWCRGARHRAQGAHTQGIQRGAIPVRWASLDVLHNMLQSLTWLCMLERSWPSSGSAKFA
jgi:hypothetical protein